MKHAFYLISDLLDHAIKEKYSTMKIGDLSIFVRNAIDWDAFTPLLNVLYHNDTEHDEKTNIPEKIVIKGLLLHSMFNMVYEQAETLIRDRISFMNFRLNLYSGNLLYDQSQPVSYYRKGSCQ